MHHSGHSIVFRVIYEFWFPIFRRRTPADALEQHLCSVRVDLSTHNRLDFDSDVSNECILRIIQIPILSKRCGEQYADHRQPEPPVLAPTVEYAQKYYNKAIMEMHMNVYIRVWTSRFYLIRTRSHSLLFKWIL